MENLYYVKYLFYLMRSDRRHLHILCLQIENILKVLAFYCKKFSNRKLLVCVYTYTKIARRHERCIGVIMTIVSALNYYGYMLLYTYSLCNKHFFSGEFSSKLIFYM